MAWCPALGSSTPTTAKQQDGSEYQRTSLLDMVRGVVRHVNSAYKSMVVEGKEAPPELSITKDPLLNVTADSTCRQLTAAGKGIITQQEAFTPDELARIIRTARDLPASSFKHSARKYLFLGINWGGRASEIAKLLDRCLKKAVDDYKEPCIKFTVPNAIKQNQGGLKRSRGAQMLDKEPIIIIYRDEFDDFLDGFSILDADKIYREAALNGSSKKAACDKLFLQMKHKSSTKGEAKDKFDVSKYLDAFINGPLGENRFSWMLQCLCLAGVEPRANHALRRTFIQACYRAGMPEAAIMRYTRHQSIEGLRCYARIDDKQLAEFARLRQQQRVAPDLDYLVQAAEAKMKQLSLTNPLQVPGGMQPKAAAAAAPSINAPTATTASAWEQEFIDLDDYEDATSPVAPTPHKKPALPPKPAMPMLADKPSQAPPAPAAQVVSVPGSSHGSSGINIVITNVPAAPGPPGYPYPPAGPYGGAYVPYGYPPYAGYGAPMPTGPYSGGFPPGMYGGYPAMPQVGSGGEFVQQQLQQHYNHHQQPQHPPFWVPGQHGSMQEQQQSNTAARTQHVPKLRLRRNVVIDDEEDG